MEEEEEEEVGNRFLQKPADGSQRYLFDLIIQEDQAD
jgi:hypothetical protein